MYLASKAHAVPLDVMQPVVWVDPNPSSWQLDPNSKHGVQYEFRLPKPVHFDDALLQQEPPPAPAPFLLLPWCGTW